MASTLCSASCADAVLDRLVLRQRRDERVAQRRHRDLAVGRAPRAIGVEDHLIVRAEAAIAMEHADDDDRLRRHQRIDAPIDARRVHVVVVRPDEPDARRRGGNAPSDSGAGGSAASAHTLAIASGFDA